MTKDKKSNLKQNHLYKLELVGHKMLNVNQFIHHLADNVVQEKNINLKLQYKINKLHEKIGRMTKAIIELAK